MSRLYVVESTPSVTGSNADHRLGLAPREIEAFARLVANRLGVEVPAPEAKSLPNVPDAWIDAVVEDLRKGSTLVLAGRQQPPVIHALAHAINQATQAVGKTVDYIEPLTQAVRGGAAERGASQLAGLKQLARDMANGRVDTLVMLGCNPVYDAPVDLSFRQALEVVPLSAHLSLYDDETSAICGWHVPEAHFLESWGDVRAFDGTATIVQPLIAPLYNGKSALEMTAALLGQEDVSAYELVRSYWQDEITSDDFERLWQEALHDGVIPRTAVEPKQVALQEGIDFGPPPAGKADGIDVVFSPDPYVWDGRFANLGWLQELPRPLSKITWDNPVLISPGAAQRLGLQNGDMVRITLGERSLEMAAWITPGQPDDAVGLNLGFGRWRSGRIGDKAGFNTYALRASDGLWFASGAEVQKTGETYPLAATQRHNTMEGRAPVRVGTLEELKANPRQLEFMVPEQHEPQQHEGPAPTLYDPQEHPYNGYKWGMAINLGACTGCNACTIACQAENNSPVVGKEQVLLEREMHWIRVDRYYRGSQEQPEIYHQPVPCMQCENAPCELVCPVGATVHSSEGLNDMVFNRCVGTRYCSNNCPYKVRRFNFLQYTITNETAPPSLKLLQNPDVTVRERGVMEKCTYCVQRISSARIAAEKRDGQIRDGEVVTACQAVCPADAIVFGDLNDTGSRVNEMKGGPLDYALLEELNTRPRTTYTAALKNPHPKLAQTTRE